MPFSSQISVWRNLEKLHRGATDPSSPTTGSLRVVSNAAKQFEAQHEAVAKATQWDRYGMIGMDSVEQRAKGAEMEFLYLVWYEDVMFWPRCEMNGDMGAPKMTFFGSGSKAMGEWMKWFSKMCF